MLKKSAMSKFLSTLLILLSVNTLFAKSDSTSTTVKDVKYGIKSGAYLTSYLTDFNYNVYGTYGFGIHEFSLGPSIGRPPEILPNIGIRLDNYQLNGIDFAYRIIPNGPGNIFDFYFQANLFQKWGNESGDDGVVKSMATQIIIEQGFDIKFLKYAYLGVSTGLGGRMERGYNAGFEPEGIFRGSLGARF